MLYILGLGLEALRLVARGSEARPGWPTASHTFWSGVVSSAFAALEAADGEGPSADPQLLRNLREGRRSFTVSRPF